MGTGTPVSPGDPITADKMNLKLETVDLSDLPAGTLRRIAEVNVESDTTSVSFTNLDINTDKVYVFYINVYNPTTDNAGIDIFVNNDTTVTNYYREHLVASGSSVGAGNVNDNRIMNVFAGTSTSAHVIVMLDPQGHVRTQTWENDRSGTDLRVMLFNVYKSTTETNVTQIDLTASVTNAIGAGSRFALYKVD